MLAQSIHECRREAFETQARRSCSRVRPTRAYRRSVEEAEREQPRRARGSDAGAGIHESSGLAGCGKNPPAAFATHVNGEASLVRGRVYGWRRMAENTDAHCRFLAIGPELSAIRSFLRTRDERRFTNNGRGDGLFAHPADDADSDRAHESITPYWATIELFRCLLDGSAGKLPHRPREPGQLFPE